MQYTKTCRNIGVAFLWRWLHTNKDLSKEYDSIQKRNISCHWWIAFLLEIVMSYYIFSYIGSQTVSWLLCDLSSSKEIIASLENKYPSSINIVSFIKQKCNSYYTHIYITNSGLAFWPEIHFHILFQRLLFYNFVIYGLYFSE